MKAIKQVFSVFLRISISVLLLWWLFRQVDRHSLLEIVRNANKPLLGLAFCFFFIVYTVTLFRWKMLLDAIDMGLTLKRVLISFSGGIFFNLFLPSSIGGDMMRGIDLAAYTKRAREVVATIFLDRLSGYIGLVIMAMFSLAIGWGLIQDTGVLLCVAIIAGILIAALLVLFNNSTYRIVNGLLRSPNAGKIRASITNLHQEIHLFREKRSLMFKNILLSLIVQVGGIASFYSIALAIGIKINMIYFFIFLPVIGAISMLPISIGGLGLRDATTIYLFAKAGVAKDLAFAMSLLNFSFILLFGLIGGLIYVLTVHHRRIQPHKAPASGCSG